MKALLFLPALAAATLAAAGVSLFDGNSLAGWQVLGESRWSVEDGEIIGAGEEDGFLATESSYGDFRLQAEFWVEAGTNSGIFIRCQDRDRIHPDTCYEFNIWDHHPKQEARTGAIVFRAMPPLSHVNTVGRWNTYEITARGCSLQAKVNGEVTARLDDADPTAGFIALQRWEQGTVRFRNLRLEPW